MGKKLLMMLLCVTLVLGVTGCGSNADNEDAKPVSLRVVFYGSAGTRSIEFWENEFHEKVLEELNIDMKLDYLPWGSEDQVATMLASGEKFAFYNAITRPLFGSNAQSGYFATIDEEMIKEVAPAFLESRMGNGFETSKYKDDIVILPVGAGIYGSAQDNLIIRNDILNKVDWDVSQIKTYEDLVEAAKAVKKAYPDMYILYSEDTLMNAIESLVCDGAIYQHFTLDKTQMTAIDHSDPDSDEVISWFESEDFIKMTKVLEDWYAMGFTNPDRLIDATAYETAWQSGNMLMCYGKKENIYNHQTLTSYFAEDVDIRYLNLDGGPGLVKKNYDWGWSFSAADQENVEHWLRFFNWMYESEENYMFCLYGVEGKDYTVDENGNIEKLTTDQFFPAWMHKSLAFEPISTDLYDEAEVEQYMNFDKTTIIAKDSGFIFDSTPVELETAALKTILTDEVLPIACGYGNVEEDFPPILKKLKAAGLDKYVEEYQRQFSEFMANK